MAGNRAQDLLGQLKSVMEDQEEVILRQNNKIQSLEEEVASLKKARNMLLEKVKHLEK